MEIEVPADERPLATGPLLRVSEAPNGRKRYLFGSAAIKEVAIFFISGKYRQFLRRDGDTSVEFFLHPNDHTHNLKYLTQLFARGHRFYHHLWGDPAQSSQQSDTKQTVSSPRIAKHKQSAQRAQNQKDQGSKALWRVVSFGGSGARGYPFTVLLDRNQGYLQQTLDGELGRLFTRRQVLLHEMAHTWWGNAVTGVGKGSLWLNEGITNYASLRAIGKLYGKQAENKAIRQHLQHFLDSQGSGKLLEPGGLAQMAQLTAYTKGALLFYELEKLLGQEIVDSGLRIFFEQYRGKMAEISDLRRALEVAAKRSLKDFFQDWVYGHGLPLIELKKWSQTPSPKGQKLQLTLHNSGSIAGMAHLRLFSATKQALRQAPRDVYLRIPPEQTHTVTIDVPWKLRDLKFDPDNTMLHGFRWQPLLEQANHLRKAQNWQAAAKLFQRLLQTYPKHGHALYSFALLHDARGELPSALPLYLLASKIPESAHTPAWVPHWARYRRAVILHRQGHRKRAVLILKQILDKSPDSYGLHDQIRKFKTINP
jgi:tetratricopeptide (TPR) repeat protein